MNFNGIFAVKSFILSATVAMSFSSQALEFRGYGALGLEFGGDTLLTIPFTNGSTKTMKAGQLALLTGGVQLNTPLASEQLLMTRLQFGFKADGTEGVDTNGDPARIDFFRWLFEVSEHFQIPNSPVNVGAGLTYHFSNSIKGEGILSGFVDVKPSLGYFLSAEWQFPARENTIGVSGYTAGVRYTIQSYEAKSSNETAKANSFGLHFGMLF